MTAHDTPRTDERAGLSEGERALDRLAAESWVGADSTDARERVHEDRATVLGALDGLAAALARAEAAEAKVAAALVVMAQGPDAWEGYDSRDVGHVFHADSVLDFTADLRAALAPTTRDAMGLETASQLAQGTNRAAGEDECHHEADDEGEARP